MLNRLLCRFLLGTVMMISLGARLYGADGSSGCGPAWYIIKENTLLSSSVRAITHGILWPISTLGMTFGTSNCSKHQIVDKNRRSLHFATKSFDVLRHDLVKGGGVYASSFLETLQCNEAIRPTVLRKIREKVALSPSALSTPELIVAASEDAIFQEPFLAMQCA